MSLRYSALSTSYLAKLTADSLRLAQSGHFAIEFRCPLLGVKRTLVGDAAMSAFDPKRTWRAGRWTDMFISLG
jgi:hypothetical protein